MTKRLDVAQKRVTQIVQARPELSLWKETPIQSATNALLYGSCNSEPIVFKVFERDYRKFQDERMLRWLAESKIVPHIYPYEFDDVIVMECLPGEMLWEVQQRESAETLTDLYEQVGGGLAKLVQHAYRPGNDETEWLNPYATEPFWNTTFEQFFDYVITTASQAIARHKITHPRLQQSLQDIQATQSEILAQPVFMHVDDVHGANIMVHEGNLQGFIDFEMSRLGNELYLLGATLQWACLNNPPQWAPMLAGYEQEQGASLSAEKLQLLKVMMPFQNWIRFAWHWESEDQPDWVWERNVREKIVDQLANSIGIVDSIVNKR